MASSYDYVIVGGGTAGLVVASRLSEDANISVLVLEAGEDLIEDPRTKIPIFYAALLGSEADWGFRTEPQPGLNGRVLGLNQGKALGGSSAMNANVFVPPAAGVIDAWESLGNPGWNWDSLKGYFAKSYSSPVVSDDMKKGLAIESWQTLSDAKGPIQTSFGNESHPIRDAWDQVFSAAGQQIVGDPFLRTSVGAFSCLASINPVTGERSYSASAYYEPAKARINLHILTGASVEKILFEKVSASGSHRATAVRYIHNGETKTASALKEVTLAAGVFQSPKILELSGVGNAELLRRHGIDVVEDLPGVGENLQDHLIAYTAFQAADDLETKDALVRQEPEAMKAGMQEYMTTKGGPLASLGVHTYAYLPLPELDQKSFAPLLSDQANVKSGFKHLQITAKALLDPKQPSAAYLTALGQTNYPLDLNDKASVPAPSTGKFVTIGVMLSQPLSRGSVHISSPKTADQPIIDPGYLTNSVDEEVIARHLLRIESLAESAPLKKLLASPLMFRDPSAKFAGDLDAAKAWARANLGSMWHFAGTCAMLPRGDGGVLDHQLKVYGVDNLRVVDASAFPLISTANTQATVYALAERAADLIKETSGKA